MSISRNDDALRRRAYIVPIFKPTPKPIPKSLGKTTSSASLSIRAGYGDTAENIIRVRSL